MSTDLTPRAPRELDARASDWLDESLDPAARAEFEAELEADPELAREVKRLEAVVVGLRRLPPVDAPPDLLRGVQGRIRRRSRGRYYGSRVPTRYRFPYEAVVNAILLGLLMAVYIISMPTPDDEPVAAPPVAERVDADAARTFLEGFGEVAVDPAEADGTLLVVTPTERLLLPLRVELERRPTLELVESIEATADRPAQLRVRVRPPPSSP